MNDTQSKDADAPGRPATASYTADDLLAVVEACAAVCESRSRSLMQQTWPDGPRRISEGAEAAKCATAIRGGWRNQLPNGLYLTTRDIYKRPEAV